MGYNFVTKATSLVVESDDNYIKNGTIDFDTTIFRPTSYGYDYDSFSSADYYQYDTGFSVRSSAHSSSTRLLAHSSSTGLLRPYTNFDLRQSSRSTTTTTTTTTAYMQCKLILYSLTHFRGQSVEIDSDITSLKS